MSFAALEDRVNQAVMRRLSNATATFGAASFPVIFDNAYQQTDLQVSATIPGATALDADAAGLVSGTSQGTIKGVNYLLVDKRPDGAGFTVLVLEEA